MIGQLSLQNRILNFTYETLPQTIILEGPSGCGKHTIVQLIAKQLNLPCEDITLQISYDTLLNLYITTQPTIYIIDINLASTSKKILNLQNAILKFIEEPPQFAKIFILCSNLNQLLSTIQNRCQIFRFANYSIQELKDYTEEFNKTHNESLPILNDYLYEIYNTPGKIQTLNSSGNVEEIEKLINNIIDNLYRANLSNILSIENKINFGQGGIDLDIFIHMMKRILISRLYTTNNFYKLKQYYIITKEFSENINLLNVKKQTLFENYLVQLKQVL